MKQAFLARQDYQRLQMMPDRTLKDIAIGRSEIDYWIDNPANCVRRDDCLTVEKTDQSDRARHRNQKIRAFRSRLSRGESGADRSGSIATCSTRETIPADAVKCHDH
ncbi:hypothetical protein [Bosea sp. (in: a-proteobacteria)]|uniref:hypothetical protein n=1 Tax=Bosea sp. (in: a-proteobacteria) TaxID=1871050 RepID=UPI00356A82BA